MTVCTTTTWRLPRDFLLLSYLPRPKSVFLTMKALVMTACYGSYRHSACLPAATWPAVQHLVLLGGSSLSETVGCGFLQSSIQQANSAVPRSSWLVRGPVTRFQLGADNAGSGPCLNWSLRTFLKQVHFSKSRAVLHSKHVRRAWEPQSFTYFGWHEDILGFGFQFFFLSSTPAISRVSSCALNNAGFFPPRLW